MNWPTWGEIYWWTMGAATGVLITIDGNWHTSVGALLIACTLIFMAKWGFEKGPRP